MTAIPEQEAAPLRDRLKADAKGIVATAGANAPNIFADALAEIERLDDVYATAHDVVTSCPGFEAERATRAPHRHDYWDTRTNVEHFAAAMKRRDDAARKLIAIFDAKRHP